jgi:heterodisulfide reductase subunit A2
MKDIKKWKKNKSNSFARSLADSNFGDVMVVGGGISGIQASLDLATAGFKVYLVEKGAEHRRPYGPA